MNARNALTKVLTVALTAGMLAGAAAASAAEVNYRSIGARKTVLYNAGTASVAGGQVTVVFDDDTGLPETVGRGDEIVIDDEELYVLSRDGDRRLTLQQAAKKDHAGREFAIRRAYPSIQDWVNDRNGDLVAEDRLEVGICYADGPLLAGHTGAIARIRGSRTDPEHYMRLTVADTVQHRGVAGAGVVLDGRRRTRHGIIVEDDFTRIEGLELKRFGRWLTTAAVVVRHARGVVLERLLIHDFQARFFESYGIKGGVGGSFTAANCVIYDGGSAGIVTRRRDATAVVENCTVFGMQGRGIDESLGSLAAVNTIAMGNRRGDFRVKRGAQSHNLSSDGSAAGEASMTFLLPADQFASLARGAEDFHLKDTAAAVDAGRNLAQDTTVARAAAAAEAAGKTAGRPPLDIDGTERGAEAAWDIGADEIETAPAGVWFVDPAQAGTGTSWKNAFGSIQEALDAAADGEEVWVKEGTYALTKEILVDKPVALYGGFAGNERSREKRDWRKRPTVLDAPTGGRCLLLDADGVRVGGFVFSFGDAAYGGAVMAQASSRFILEDCRFEGNAASYGGGLYARNAAGSVTNCFFTGNLARMSGGAVYLQSSAVSLVNCIFSQNSAGGSGISSTGGGAVFVQGSGAVITNCSFYDNSTRFSANGGGAVHNFLASTVIANSILWGNTAAVGPQVHNNISSAATLRYCDIDQPGWEGLDGNMRRDPLWADPDGGDFGLTAGSPCIDAGTLVAADLPEFDFEGDPRVVGTSVDMGADEALD